jgi:hypothetical protein
MRGDCSGQDLSKAEIDIYIFIHFVQSLDW